MARGNKKGLGLDLTNHGIILKGGVTQNFLSRLQRLGHQVWMLSNKNSHNKTIQLVFPKDYDPLLRQAAHCDVLRTAEQLGFTVIKPLDEHEVSGSAEPTVYCQLVRTA